MLIHQTWESDGVVAAAVVLNSRTISEVSPSVECHAGIRLASSGQAFKLIWTGGQSQLTGEWLVVGTPSDFFVKRTLISGTLTTDTADGFLQLNTTRTWEIVEDVIESPRTTVIFLEIASDASGIPIVATATITLVALVSP